MKQTFPGYYRPTEDEFQNLWGNCLFVLDANVLLNLYCYSESGRKDLIEEIFKPISDRLWVPHQVALEYHSNRRTKIMEQANKYKNIQPQLRRTQQDLDQLRTHKEHPFVNVELIDKIKDPLAEILQELEKRKQEQVELLDADHILHSVTELLEGRIGCPYGEEKMQEIYKQWKTRYENRIPPGYRDGAQKCGDLILWLQTIDKAKEENKPIIFVTDEAKGDWWEREDDKIIGPRPELINEMKYRAGVSFYMYSADEFLERVPEYMGLQVKPETIDEVRSVREIDEALANLRFLPQMLAAMTRVPEFRLPPQMLEAMTRVPELPPEMFEAMTRAAQFQPPPEMLKAMRQAAEFRPPPEMLKAMRQAAQFQPPPEALKAMRQVAQYQELVRQAAWALGGMGRISRETLEGSSVDESVEPDSEDEQEGEAMDAIPPESAGSTSPDESAEPNSEDEQEAEGTDDKPEAEDE